MQLSSSLVHRFFRSKSNRKYKRTQLFETLETRTLYSVGGGFVGSGIHGDYYKGINLDNNGTISAAFSRSDVRIDFDWSSFRSPGGSASAAQASIGTDDYSVRWTGQVIARYSEKYTFKTTSDNGVRLYIKAAGSNTWTMLIDNWTNHDVAVDSGSFNMVAGQKYDIKMEYYETTGDAIAKLKWSSASTPEEIIEPVAQIGVNGSSAMDYEAGSIFADLMKAARLQSYKGLTSGSVLDANGWPTGDAQFILYHGLNYDMRGAYTMTFNGQADVKFDWGPMSVTSKVYDAKTNTTTVKFVCTSGEGIALRSSSMQLTFTNTRRSATDTTATGITNIKIMRPTSPGSSVSYAPTDVFTNQYKELISKFTVIRNMDYQASNTNANSTKNWDDRLKPGYSSQQGTLGSYQGTGGAIEYAVALSNETGKDLWLNIPIQATDDYITKLAYALKYGTDANGNPYTSPQANPVYAPLNPNLKVYLELSNEVWNGIFPQAQLAKTIAQQEVANNTETGKAINYDNVNDPNVWMQRWWALRTAQVSIIFRTVWGDQAMMETVRPVFQFQYGNLNNTAVNPLQFLDNYLNNANGNHVANPHAVNYYLYAAGGGWYSGLSDSSGLGTVAFVNPSFETVKISTPKYQQAPASTGWNFSGTSGIVVNGATSTLNGVTITPPNATQGTQAAYISGTGSISQKVTLPAGVMDITFQIAQGTTGSESISVYIDDKLVTTNMTAGKTTYSFFRAGALNVSAGEHTITIKGAGNGIVYLDDLKIETVDSIYKKSTLSDITSTSRTEVNWAAAYGLKTVGYEGGFSIGGDSPNPVALAANADPRAQQYTLQTVQAYYAAGGYLPIVFNAANGGYAVAANTTYGWPSLETFDTAKLRGYEQAMSTLTPAMTNGLVVPNVLDATNMTLWLGNFEGSVRSDQAGNIYKQGGWVSWNINVPSNGSYVLNTSTLGTGGKFVVLVDEQVIAVGESGKDVSSVITLSPGLHSVKVRSTDAVQFRVTKISIGQAQAPTVPVLNTATLNANGQLNVKWSAVNGVSGYKVIYGTTPDNMTSEVDMGSNTSGTINGLTKSPYYVAVYSYDVSGRRSLLSNTIRVAIPAAGKEFKIDFEGQTTGTSAKSWAFGDYTISGLGNGGNLQIQDSSAQYWPGGWASKTLFALNWGNGQKMERTDHAAFNLYSLDLHNIGSNGSAVITGYDASGATFKQIVNFGTAVNGHVSSSVVLNWSQITRVDVRWYEKIDGGGGERFGAIDNVLFNKGGTTNPTPSDPGPNPGNTSPVAHTVDAKTSYSYVDANGDTVTVKLSGPGTATVYRLDAIQMDAAGIVLGGTTNASSLSITVTNSKSSPKTTTLGDIYLGSGQLKSISADAVDLIGKGLIGGTGSYVTTIALRDLLGGADIVLPGNAPKTSVSLTARHVGDGSNIQIVMPVATLTLADFGNGVIETSTLGALKTTGISGSLAGDFGGTITLNNSACSTGDVLGSATITGTILGGTWNVSGATGTISALATTGSWKGIFNGSLSKIAIKQNMSGTLQAISVGTWIIGGNMSQMTVTLGNVSNAGKDVLGSLTVTMDMLNNVLTSTGNISTIAARSMKGNTILAGVLGSTLPTSSSGFGNNATIGAIVVTGDTKNKTGLMANNQIAAKTIKNLIAFYPDEQNVSRIVTGSLESLYLIWNANGKVKTATFKSLTASSPPVSISGFDVDLV